MNNLLILFALLFSHSILAQTWTAKTDMPSEARKGGVMCYLDNTLYIGLGEGEGGVETMLTDWYAYDISTDIWTEKASFPSTGRLDPLYFTLNGKIYVGCGYEDDLVLKNDFYVYDPMTDEWNSISNFPGGIRVAGIHFSTDNYGYVGAGRGPSFGDYNNDLWRYDDLADTWTEINAFGGSPRWRTIVFEIDNTIYAGCGGNSSNLSDIWKYNEDEDSWTVITDYPGNGTASTFAIAIDGFVYIGTGSPDPTTTAYQDVHRYDPIADIWTSEPDFPGGARSHTSFYSTGTLAWVFGGGSASGRKKDLWAFYDLSSGIKEINKTEILVYPNPAKDYIFIPNSNVVDSFEVYTLQGEIVLKGKMGAFIDVRNIESGFYILKSTQNGQSFTQKISIVD